MYEGDSPIAERRAAALTLDQGLLAELLGRAELRELLDPEVLAEVESELQRLAEDRRVRDSEGIADLLRLLGPLSTDEIRARCTTPDQVDDWLSLLVDARRVVPVLMCGPRALGRRRGRRPAARRPRRPGAAGRAGRVHRAGRGPARRPGRPLRPHPRPVPRRRGRRATRSRRRRRATRRWPGSPAQGRVLEGEFRPSGAGAEWCDAEVLRSLRRRSLARLRHEVEPVEPVALARFLPGWQHVGSSGRPRGCAGSTAWSPWSSSSPGAPYPPRALESLVLPSRVARLPAGDARRADRDRRGALGRPRRAARAPTAGSRCTSPTPHR